MHIALCFACSYLYPIIFRRELPSVNSYPLAIIYNIQLSIDHIYLESILCLGYRSQIRLSPQQALLFGFGHYAIFHSLLWLLVGTQRDQKRGNPAMCNHSGPHDTGNTKSICESHNEDATLHILQREDGWGLC